MKFPALIPYTFKVTQKYIIAKTGFTCFHNAGRVSSVNDAYLLTRTREKQRETNREKRQHVYDTTEKRKGKKKNFLCHVAVCLAL